MTCRPGEGVLLPAPGYTRKVVICVYVSRPICTDRREFLVALLRCVYGRGFLVLLYRPSGVLSLFLPAVSVL